jgi:hypothetical protein
LNNNILSTKKTISLFLAFVLVTGTIALSSTSSMRDVQAQQGYDGTYNNYEKDYGKDNNSYKSKDNKIVKKVKCNNINVNVNGLELDVFPPFLGGEGLAVEATEGNTDPSSFARNGDNSEINDFRFICINNNNNTVIEEGEEPVTPPTPPEPPEPTTANLAVTKTTNCELGTPFCTPPPNPQITVTGVNPNPSSFLASQTPVDVTLGAGSYSVSEAGFISGLSQCLPFQGGQLIIGQTIYMCTNFSADCEGDISAGQQLSCTIENTLIVVD